MSRAGGTTPKAKFRVFAPDRMSNTHDFGVRYVTYDGRRMYGVFARRAIGVVECPVFIGVYPGVMQTKDQVERKLADYAARHGVSRAEALRVAAAYNLAADRLGVSVELDPGDTEGRLLPEYAGHMACYINEPPPGSYSKAAFVYNEPRERYEVWLVRRVGQGEDVFLCYGDEYERDYLINTAACADWDGKHVPADSLLLPDPRGAPEPLVLP